MSRAGMLRLLLSFLRPFAGEVALSVLLGVATIAASIGLLGTSAYLIASAALHPSIAALQVAIVGVRFFGISRAMFRYLERLVSHSVNFRLLADLRIWFYQKVEPLAPARTIQYRSADLLSRAIADIETLENFYVRAVAPPFVALITTGGVSWFAGRYDLRLGLFLAAVLILAGVGLPVFAHFLSRAPGRDLVERRAELNAAVLDMVQGLPDLLAFGQSQAQVSKIQAAGGRFGEARQRIVRAGALGNALGVLLAGVALWGVLVLAIPLVGRSIDGITLAVLTLVALASFEAVTPLTAAAQHLESSLQAARRLLDLVEGTLEVVDTPQAETLVPGPMNLSIKGLAFKYGQDELPALSGIDLDLPAGKHVALVGASGAGKTTLLNLLLRFWEYHQGRIEINGQDIRCYAAEAVREQMALVSQNTYLFSGTIRQNLLLANPNASPEAMEQAVRQSQLGALVTQLPQGMDTWVGERGLHFSAGERQRLAIARALLRDAPILLLDEPTASLDAFTERSVLAALGEASRGRSLLAITHRLVGLEEMDEILVLQEGRVVERGTHASLLAARGVYAQMWQIQSERL